LNEISLSRNRELDVRRFYNFVRAREWTDTIIRQ